MVINKHTPKRCGIYVSNWDFYLLQFSALFHYFTQLIAYVISAKILFCDKNVKGKKEKQHKVIYKAKNI